MEIKKVTFTTKIIIHSVQLCIAILLSAGVFLAHSTNTHAASPVSYKKNIAPLFKRSCLKCHGPKKQKGELRLDSLKHMMKGSENGKVVVPGNAKKSTIYTSTTLDPEDDDYMPVKGQGLDESEIDLIKRWINESLSGELKKAGL